MNPIPTVIRHTDPDYRDYCARLNRFALPDSTVSETVREIIDQVRRRGDAALIEFTTRFDHIELTPQTIALRRLPAKPDVEIRRALDYAHGNIRKFSAGQKPKNWRKKNREGASVGEQYQPFDRVGIYVPGGTAPLVSTALMTVTLAKTAGVKEIVAVTPPPVNEVLLYALKLAGATEIYHVGGAQAIAALAYGTESIPRVQKIFGPGNAYVIEAKRQVLGAVAIDQLPGPSEIAVIADDSARPDFIAADLLAQAEHGHGSRILFLTPSQQLLDRVLAEIESQLAKLSRQTYLRETLNAGSAFVLTKNLKDAIKLMEDYAPEHLSLVVKNASKIARGIKNSGAIFIGNYSPVAAGDFIAGPSHTLPTGGAAKSFSGLTIDQFYKRTSVVEYSPKALDRVIPYIEKFSELEQLDAHGKSASIRRVGKGKK